MDEEPDDVVEQEVEALRAIYGDDRITFHRTEGPCSTTVTISLDGLTLHPPTALLLTVKLPADYPTTHPTNPTLRAEGFTAARCERLVEEMMDAQVATEGMVCLYEWVEAMINVLNDHQPEIVEITNPGIEGSGSIERRFRIVHGEPLKDRKSTFQAHLAFIKSVDEVDEVLQELHSVHRKVESASHNTLAYRVRCANGVTQDADDDGEKGAGKIVLYVLQKCKAVNVVVIVSRWFGGVKLGPVRFRHIAKVVGDVMEGCRGEYESEVPG